MRTPSLHSIDGDNANNSTISQGVYDVFFDFTPPQSTVKSSPSRLHQIPGQLRLIYQSNLTFSFFHFKHYSLERHSPRIWQPDTYLPAAAPAAAEATCTLSQSLIFVALSGAERNRESDPLKNSSVR